MDSRFWAGPGGKPVYDENGFYAGRMQEDRTGQDLLLRGGRGEVLIPRVENLIDNLVRVPETGMRLPGSSSSANSSGVLSLPTNGLSVGRHVGYERFDEGLGSSVGMPVPCSNRYPRMEQQACSTGRDGATFMDQASDREHGNVNLTVSCSHALVNENDVQSDNTRLPNGVTWGSYKEAMASLRSPVSSYDLLYEKSQFQRLPKPKAKRKEVHGSDANPIMKRSAFEPFDSYPVMNNSASKDAFGSFPIMTNSSSREPSDSFPTMRNSASEEPFESSPVVRKSAPRDSSDSSSTVRKASKEPFDNFPHNARSVMSTGIFNEALVRYIAPLKELPGIISAAGYLCGCEACNFSKAISAAEFEIHAGHKSKHPNNHIRFENGKSMHEIVLELRLTSRSKLIDAFQTVTGCPINQDALNAWKELYKAELEASSV